MLFLHMAFSLSLMFSYLLQVSVVHSFLMLSSILLNEYAIICFIHSPIEGRLGLFLFGAIINEIALNIFVSEGICFHFS